MKNCLNAVVLLSGGIDSTTSMAMAKSEGYEIYCLSFRYGQRHALELKAAKRVAEVFAANEHLILDIDLTKISCSALTNRSEVPKNRNEKEISQGIPVTYVPARNTIFLSYALAWAEMLEASDIFIGLISGTDNKSEIKKYKSFSGILFDLKNRNLTREQILSIENELDILELRANPENRKKYFSKKLTKFKSLQ